MQIVVNPSGDERRDASAELVYIASERGPVAVLYDAAAGAHARTRSNAPSGDTLAGMLRIADEVASQQIELQRSMLAGAGGRDSSMRDGAPWWLDLEPSRAAMDRVRAVGATAMDNALDALPASRGGQIEHLALAKVRLL